VDIRGSTTLAERTSPDVFAALMNRFYTDATRVLVKSEAFIDKFVGDEVMAVYLPVFCGPNHAFAAVEASRQLLEVTGREVGGHLPIGVGVNTGVCYFGTVKGVEGTLADVTALGDPVNVCARLAGVAGPGEALVSEAACAASGLDLSDCEARSLALKGKSDPTSVRVLKGASPLPGATA